MGRRGSFPAVAGRGRRKQGFARLAALFGATVCALYALAPAASAQVLVPGVDPGPIPSPGSGGIAVKTGKAVIDDPFAFRSPPRHPFMAPNGKSNIHVDAYQSDTNTAGGPLGPGSTDSAYFCLLYTSPSPRDGLLDRMPSSA